MTRTSTPAQDRTQIKREWAAKLRENGHALTWQFHGSRDGRRLAPLYAFWTGHCKNCPGHIEVSAGGASTYQLGWTGNKPCPGPRRHR